MAARHCALDGTTLESAGDVYRALADALGFPDYFGNNADALWDALGDRAGDAIEITWRDTAMSRTRLGADYEKIVAVLEAAVARGWVRTLRLL